MFERNLMYNRRSKCTHLRQKNKTNPTGEASSSSLRSQHHHLSRRACCFLKSTHFHLSYHFPPPLVNDWTPLSQTIDYNEVQQVRIPDTSTSAQLARIDRTMVEIVCWQFVDKKCVCVALVWWLAFLCLGCEFLATTKRCIDSDAKLRSQQEVKLIHSLLLFPSSLQRIGTFNIQYSMLNALEQC